MNRKPFTLGRVALWIAPALLLGILSCSSSGHAGRELSERERDSVIARSVLPGAAVVGRAMAISDRAQRRSASMDSLTR